MKKRIFSFLVTIIMTLSTVNISVQAKVPGTETMKATNIGETAAKLRGKVTSNSGIKIKEYGFGWGVVGSTSLEWKHFYAGEDFYYPNPENGDIIEYKVTDLKPGKRYFYVFYAINENGEEGKDGGKNFSTEAEKDTIYPNIDCFECSDGLSFEEGTKVKFYAEASDNDEIDEMWLFINGLEVANSTTDEISYSISDLEPGKHEIGVEAMDKSGNSTFEDIYVTVTKKESLEILDTSNWEEEETPLPTDGGGFVVKQIDTQKPSVINFKCDASSSVNRNVTDTITFKAEAIDNVGVVSMTLFNGVSLKSQRGSTISATVQTSGLSLGENEFYIIATDAAGNEGYSNSIYITLYNDYTQSYEEPEYEIIQKDTTKPQITHIYCDEGTEIDSTFVDEFTVHVNTTDNEKVDHVEFYLSGIGNIGSISPDNNKASITIPSVYLSMGTNNEISAIAVDISGNKSAEKSFRIERIESTYYKPISSKHDEAYEKASFSLDVQVYVDGKKLYFDVTPRLINSRTMVPLRTIFEELGAWVTWDNNNQTVKAYKDDTIIELTIGDYYMYVNNSYVYLDSPGVVINGRTLVPVRAISEALNCEVEWYGDKQLVSIVSE